MADPNKPPWGKTVRETTEEYTRRERIVYGDDEPSFPRSTSPGRAAPLGPQKSATTVEPLVRNTVPSLSALSSPRSATLAGPRGAVQQPDSQLCGPAATGSRPPTKGLNTGSVTRTTVPAAETDYAKKNKFSAPNIKVSNDNSAGPRQRSSNYDYFVIPTSNDQKPPSISVRDESPGFYASSDSSRRNAVPARSATTRENLPPPRERSGKPQEKSHAPNGSGKKTAGPDALRTAIDERYGGRQAEDAPQPRPTRRLCQQYSPDWNADAHRRLMQPYFPSPPPPPAYVPPVSGQWPSQGPPLSNSGRSPFMNTVEVPVRRRVSGDADRTRTRRQDFDSSSVFPTDRGADRGGGYLLPARTGAGNFVRTSDEDGSVREYSAFDALHSSVSPYQAFSRRPEVRLWRGQTRDDYDTSPWPEVDKQHRYSPERLIPRRFSASWSDLELNERTIEEDFLTNRAYTGLPSAVHSTLSRSASWIAPTSIEYGIPATPAWADAYVTETREASEASSFKTIRRVVSRTF